MHNNTSPIYNAIVASSNVVTIGHTLPTKKNVNPAGYH